MSGTNTSNPFSARGNYSAEAVELMRAMSEFRQQSRSHTSSPQQIVEVLQQLSYRHRDESLALEQLGDLFAKSLHEYQQRKQIAHPTCEDVISVLDDVGFYRTVAETPTVLSGLPIDRRRRSNDSRNEPTERRSSTALSAQEKMELSETEHQLLDELQKLRQETGREFASSEELLSIIWRIGFRPANEEGLPMAWIDEDERVRQQVAFSAAVEQQLVDAADDEFLTCRDLLKIVEQLNYQLA